MKLEQINTIIHKTKKGTIHTISYTKQLKTLKGVTDVITKSTRTQGRLGVTYDNISKVKDARQTGELPTTNQGLPTNTEWEYFPYLIKNTKTGAIQLRVSRTNSGNSETKYYRNGVEVQKSEIEHLCLKSEFPNYSAAVEIPIFNIGIEKIDYIV